MRKGLCCCCKEPDSFGKKARFWWNICIQLGTEKRVMILNIECNSMLNCDYISKLADQHKVYSCSPRNSCCTSFTIKLHTYKVNHDKYGVMTYTEDSSSVTQPWTISQMKVSIFLKGRKKTSTLKISTKHSMASTSSSTIWAPTNHHGDSNSHHSN